MSEMIPIVNRSDKFIKYKKRGLESCKDIYRISALWIVNSKNQVLLAQRSFNKKHSPGKWGPAVAGTVAKGENYLENIIKETDEEIGIDLIEYEFEEVDKTFNKTSHSFFCQWYFLRADITLGKFTFSKDEVEQLKWADYDKLISDTKKHPEKYTTNAGKYAKLLKKY